MSNLDLLYAKAYELSPARELIPTRSGCGGVASALMTASGNVYTGICLDYACGLGFCAEHAAIAEMLKHGESQISEIVAVHRSGTILAACGRCREMIAQTDVRNRDTVVHLTSGRQATIRELLPDYWLDVG